MATSPMADASVIILEEVGTELSFQDLFKKVVAKLELDEATATKRIARMYSDLTLDKRFISLPENKWDLRKRHRLEEILVDTSDIIIEDEEVEELDEDGNQILEADYDSLEEDDTDTFDDDIKELSKIASLSDDE